MWTRAKHDDRTRRGGAWPLRRAGRPARLRRCRFERLTDRLLLHGGSLAAALQIEPDSVTPGELAHTGESAYYQFSLNEPGRVALQTEGHFLNTRTSLLGPEGQLLIQSDGRTAADPRRDRLAAEPDRYFLRRRGPAFATSRLRRGLAVALRAEADKAMTPRIPSPDPEPRIPTPEPRAPSPESRPPDSGPVI